MNKDSYKVIRRPLITEKGMAGANRLNQYPFDVDPAAGKADIKKAVEELFSVHVKNVRTMSRKGKPRHYRYWKGTTSPWKRAIVTIAPGETIEFI
jgi:large subunit ribosomal protein L23